jgi:AraC family transcriptional regulator
MLEQLRSRSPGGVSILFPKDHYRLHAMVTSAGYDDCRNAAYDWQGLKRGEAPFALLQCTISGSGNLRYEHRRLTVRAGQTMLLRFPHDNRYWLGRNDHWEFFWLCLNGREVLRVWREIIDAHGPLVTLKPATTERLAGLCLSVLNGEANRPAGASSIAYAVAMHLADELLSWGEGRSSSDRPAAIERAVSLCQTRTEERLDVERLAKAAGYSRYHFSRLFAAHEGMSPARYVMSLKMEEAARQLQMDGVSIKEVASKCGFEDPNYFSKVFRRFYGISPRDFRRSGMFSGPPSEPPPAGGDDPEAAG